MKAKVRLFCLVLVLMIALVPLAGCATSSPQAKSTAVRVALIMPGPISDSDWNMLGYEALQVVAKEQEVETAYSEKIAVADAERVAREYIAEDYNVIIFHGGQFVTATMNLAGEYPDVTFIMGSATPVPDLPPNVWNMVRRYYKGGYALGDLAARMTKTGKIGYLAGVQLPDFMAIANSVHEAAGKVDPNIEVIYSFTGDQNDPVKARQAADAMIAEGVDVIIDWMNAGVSGVEEAVLASDDVVLMTTFSTDKHERAPERYLVSMLLDLGVPYSFMVGEIKQGKTTGVFDFEPGSGMLLSPTYNMPDGIAASLKSLWSQLENDEVIPTENTEKLFDQ